MTRKMTQYFLGTSALLASIALTLTFSPNIRYKVADPPELAREKNGDVFYIPPDESFRFYVWRHQRLSDELNKLAKKSGRSVEEKIRRYQTALKETILRILFHPDGNRFDGDYGDGSNAEYQVQTYCELCVLTRDVDGLTRFEKELDESKFSEKYIERYQRYARNQELIVEIRNAVDNKDDAELERCVAKMEDVALNDALTPETDFANRLKYFLAPIDSRNTDLGQKAREYVKKGYKNSARPLLAEVEILK